MFSIMDKYTLHFGVKKYLPNFFYFNQSILEDNFEFRGNFFAYA